MKSITKAFTTKKLAALLIALAIVLATAFACGFGFTSKSASAATASSAGVNSDGLGLAVNAVTKDCLDLTELRDGATIFNSSWIETQVANANKIDVRTSTSGNFSKYNFAEFSEEYSSDLGLSESVTGGIDIFTGGLSETLNSGIKINFSKYSSNYFFLSANRTQQYTLSMPDYASNLSAYKANLNSNFINAVANVVNSRITYKSFFDTYGTHIIMKGIYGGSFNIFYCAASNSYDFEKDFGEQLTNDVKGGIERFLKVNSSFEFKIASKNDGRSLDVSECNYIVAKGGGVYTGCSINSYSDTYSNWVKSVEDNPVLISATSDGMVPIWEFLPVQYSSYKQTIINAYKNYAKEYNNSVLSKYPVTATYERAGTKTVTDAGPMKEVHCENFDMSLVPKSYSELNSAGYKYATVSVVMDMREINKGYQQVFLYPTNTTNYNDKLFAIEVQYDGDKLNKDFSQVIFKFPSLPMDNFKKSGVFGITVRYGATGGGEDDWQNRNVKITVSFSKEKATSGFGAYGSKISEFTQYQP